jgi:cardiolipin synthase
VPEKALRQLPNSISFARLILGPVVGWMIATGHDWAWWCFFMGAWSDAVDGWLARALRVESSVGLYLDPLADKVFVTLTTVAWAVAGRIPVWLLALILGRDVIILGGSALIYAVRKRKDFSPTWWGKLSTVFQLMALGACFWFTDWWLGLFLALTAIGTAVSLVDYVRLGWAKWNCASLAGFQSPGQ